jgi:hypothetical protein
MFSTTGGALLGAIRATSVSGRGFTPEELADAALDRIIYVGGDSHPAIRDQAQAFKEQIRGVLVQYGYQVIRSNNTTIANHLREAGHPELVRLLEK